MKTVSKKPSPRRRAAEPHQAIAVQLEAMHRSLHDIMSELRNTPRPSTSETRYLSEATAESYQPIYGRLAGPDETIEFCKKHFHSLIHRALQEELHVLTLNGSHRVIRSHQVTVGLVNSTQVHSREVFRPAILDSAAGIILIHNHPSGNSEPSREDLKVTSEVEAAGKVVGIPLLDHIVVAREGCTSIIEWRKSL